MYLYNIWDFSVIIAMKYWLSINIYGRLETVTERPAGVSVIISVVSVSQTPLHDYQSPYWQKCSLALTILTRPMLLPRQTLSWGLRTDICLLGCYLALLIVRFLYRDQDRLMRDWRRVGGNGVKICCVEMSSVRLWDSRWAGSGRRQADSRVVSGGQPGSGEC